MTKLLAAIAILGLNAYVFWYLGSDEVIPPRTPFAEFPDRVGEWRCLDREEMDEAIIENLKVTDYISCVFFKPTDNENIHLYVGYHQRQTRDRETGATSSIHPPEHCLPGSGWDVIGSKIVPIESGPGGEAKRFIIAKGNQRALVYFWYQSRGRVIARNYQKILWMFLDRARRGRTDGSLVRFTIPIQHGDVEAAEASFHEFEEQVVPLLPEFIPD